MRGTRRGGFQTSVEAAFSFLTSAIIGVLAPVKSEKARHSISLSRAV